MLREPLEFTEPRVDDVPVTRLFFFMAPSARGHLELLGRLSRSLACEPLLAAVSGPASDEEIYRAFKDFDALGKNGEAS